MKMVVLCAGEGKRLRPYTSYLPKCMVPYRGKPLLHYTLDAARECRVDDVVLFSGYLADRIVAPLARAVWNPEYATTNMVYTLFRAEDELDCDLVVSYGDIVYTPAVLKAILESAEPISVAVDQDWKSLWQLRMEDPLQDAESLRMDENNYIKDIGKKPRSYEDVEGQYIGLVKISKGVLPELVEFYRSLETELEEEIHRNLFMTSFLQLVVDRLMPVKAVLVDGGWFEIDTPDDLKIDYTERLSLK